MTICIPELNKTNKWVKYPLTTPFQIKTLNLPVFESNTLIEKA